MIAVKTLYAPTLPVIIQKELRPSPSLVLVGWLVALAALTLVKKVRCALKEPTEPRPTLAATSHHPAKLELTANPSSVNATRLLAMAPLPFVKQVTNAFQELPEAQRTQTALESSVLALQHKTTLVSAKKQGPEPPKMRRVKLDRSALQDQATLQPATRNANSIPALLELRPKQLNVNAQQMAKAPIRIAKSETSAR